MAFEVKGGGGPKTSPNHVSHDDAAEYFRRAIEYVTQSQKAKTVYDRLVALPTTIPVEVIHDNNDFYAPAYAGPGGGYIHWDPLSALQITEGGWQSPAVGLIHEMYHAYQEFDLKDVYPNMPQKLVSAGAGAGKTPVIKPEIDTVEFEKGVCNELRKLGHENETSRTTYAYSIGTIDVTGPCSTGKAVSA